MSKRVMVCKEYLKEACEKVEEALNKVADSTFGFGINEVVHTTTKSFKEQLLKLCFEDEKGEQDG